nr:helix-turn-helix domain-containing protein [Clostridium pasteurianum]
MAEELGIPRPSLSRELVNMKKDGLIDFHKNTFKILNLEAMEDILMN